MTSRPASANPSLLNTSLVGAPGLPEAPPAPAHPMQLRTGTPSAAKFVMLLGAMCALAAMTTDMYLPSLPEVGSELGASMAAVQFTITGTLIGGALGQLIIGPLSDRFGRRAPVFIGVTLHIVASLACLFAFTVDPLIALRILQGIGNASAGVVAIALIRDRLDGAAASAVLSRLMLVIGLAPLLAPSLGSAIAHLWGWRAVFTVLAVMGAVLMLAVWRYLPETVTPGAQRTSALRSYATLLRDRTFLAFAILPGLTLATLFSYVAGSPFVFREGYGLTEAEFSILFAVNGIALVIGAQINARLVRTFAPVRIIRLALPAGLLMALILMGVAITGVGGLMGLLIPLFLMLGFLSLVPPNASALALTRHGDRAGAAAAMIGFCQASVGGVVAPLVGVFGGDAIAMAAVMVVALVLGMLILCLATPAYRRGGWSGGAATA